MEGVPWERLRCGMRNIFLTTNQAQEAEIDVEESFAKRSRFSARSLTCLVSLPRPTLFMLVVNLRRTELLGGAQQASSLMINTPATVQC